MQISAGRKPNDQCVTNADGKPKWYSSAGVNVATQTVGLYYPSQREISRREQELSDKEKAAKDYKPVLTPISPGRGSCLVAGRTVKVHI